MHREGDLIHFDEDDKRRYAKLPDWLPVEATPELFRQLVEQKETAKAQLSVLSAISPFTTKHRGEHQTALAETTQTLSDLEKVVLDLAETAGADLIALDLPLGA
jgi:hypothetical protein